MLLLDEPTNHLDIAAQEALQEVLESFAGTVLLVSHDRYLIDRLATHIRELRNGRLSVFKGTYREFVLQRTAPTTHAQRIILPPKPLCPRQQQGDPQASTSPLAARDARIETQEATLNA